MCVSLLMLDGDSTICLTLCLQVWTMFGSSWCHHCHELFPSVYEISKKVAGLFQQLSTVRKPCPSVSVIIWGNALC